MLRKSIVLFIQSTSVDPKPIKLQPSRTTGLEENFLDLSLHYLKSNLTSSLPIDDVIKLIIFEP